MQAAIASASGEEVQPELQCEAADLIARQQHTNVDSLSDEEQQTGSGPGGSTESDTQRQPSIVQQQLEPDGVRTGGKGQEQLIGSQVQMMGREGQPNSRDEQATGSSWLTTGQASQELGMAMPPEDTFTAAVDFSQVRQALPVLFLVSRYAVLLATSSFHNSRKKV